MLDERSVVDVCRSDVATVRRNDAFGTNDEAVTNDEVIPLGANGDEVGVGVRESATVNKDKEFVGCSKVFVEKSEVANGRVDDASCTTDEVATNDVRIMFGVDDVDVGVLDSTIADEDKEVIGCTTVLVDAMGVDVDNCDVATGRVDDTSCTADEVVANEVETTLGASGVEVDVVALDSAFVDDGKKVVGFSTVLEVGIAKFDAVDGRLVDLSTAIEDKKNDDDAAASAINVFDVVSVVFGSTRVAEDKDFVGSSEVLAKAADIDVLLTEAATVRLGNAS